MQLIICYFLLGDAKSGPLRRLEVNQAHVFEWDKVHWHVQLGVLHNEVAIYFKLIRTTSMTYDFICTFLSHEVMLNMDSIPKAK